MDLKEIILKIEDWSVEILSFDSVMVVPFNNKGPEQCLKGLETLSGWISRLDEIYSIMSGITSRIESALFLKETEIEYKKFEAWFENSKTWVASGYSAKEREDLALLSRTLFSERKFVTELKVCLVQLKAFERVLIEKKKSLSAARYSCNIAKDLLDIGLKLGEVK